VQDSSSSSPTVRSTRSESLLQLGKRIVDELGRDPRVDTLACWMAHYIAELIQAAETAAAEERPAKLKHCADAILDFWKHRFELPSGKRPFEDFEAIMRALESLDPREDGWRYFRPARLEEAGAETNAATRKWLETAYGLDYTARVLIRFCLVRAAESELDKSRPWVALAEAAGLADGFEFSVIRLVAVESDLQKAVDPDDTERKIIEDRIRRLEAFTGMAAGLASDLRAQLEKAGAPKRGL
jgi:hypothetical protein